MIFIWLIGKIQSAHFVMVTFFQIHRFNQLKI